MPNTGIPNSVTLCSPDEFEVVPYTVGEFITAEGHVLSHVNDLGQLDFALLTKGERRCIRGYRRLYREDVNRALSDHWEVTIIHLSVGQVQDYTVLGISVLNKAARHEQLCAQLEDAQADWETHTAVYRAGLVDTLNTYFAGER